MSNPLTVPLDELAAMLGTEPDTVRRQHRRWSDQHGFPRKLAVGWAWSRRDLKLWIEQGMARPANDPLPCEALKERSTGEMPAALADDPVLARLRDRYVDNPAAHGAKQDLSCVAPARSEAG